MMTDALASALGGRARANERARTSVRTERRAVRRTARVTKNRTVISPRSPHDLRGAERKRGAHVLLAARQRAQRAVGGGERVSRRSRVSFPRVLLGPVAIRTRGDQRRRDRERGFRRDDAVHRAVGAQTSPRRVVARRRRQPLEERKARRRERRASSSRRRDGTVRRGIVRAHLRARAPQRDVEHRARGAVARQARVRRIGIGGAREKRLEERARARAERRRFRVGKVRAAPRSAPPVRPSPPPPPPPPPPPRRRRNHGGRRRRRSPPRAPRAPSRAR